jgi:hypothetical protein
MTVLSPARGRGKTISTVHRETRPSPAGSIEHSLSFEDESMEVIVRFQIKHFATILVNTPHLPSGQNTRETSTQEKGNASICHFSENAKRFPAFSLPCFQHTCLFFFYLLKSCTKPKTGRQHIKKTVRYKKKTIVLPPLKKASIDPGRKNSSIFSS